MRKFTTQIRAIDSLTGELLTWCGPHIEALTFGMAKKWCEENAGYLEVTGELVAEIPADGFNTDFKNGIHYDFHNN